MHSTHAALAGRGRTLIVHDDLGSDAPRPVEDERQRKAIAFLEALLEAREHDVKPTRREVGALAGENFDRIRRGACA